MAGESPPSWRSRDRLRKAKPANYRAILFYCAGSGATGLVGIAAVALGSPLWWTILAWCGSIFVLACIATIWEQVVAGRRVKRELLAGAANRARWAAEFGPHVSDLPLTLASGRLAEAEGRAPSLPIWPGFLVLFAIVASSAGCWLGQVPFGRALLLTGTIVFGVGAMCFELMSVLIRRRLRRLLRDGNLDSARAFAHLAEVEYVLDLRLEEVFHAAGRLYVPLFTGLGHRPWELWAGFAVGSSALFAPVNPLLAYLVAEGVFLAVAVIRWWTSHETVLEALVRLRRGGEDELAATLEQVTGGKESGRREG